MEKSRLLRALSRWSLEQIDARILWSELEKSYRRRVEAEGRAAEGRGAV